MIALRHWTILLWAIVMGTCPHALEKRLADAAPVPAPKSELSPSPKPNAGWPIFSADERWA